MLRLLIAEDFDYLREQLVALLNSSQWITVVGTAQDSRETVDLCRRLQPDVVLIDTQMPLTDDFDAAEHIHQKFPAIRVVIFSSGSLRENIDTVQMGGKRFSLQPTTLRHIVQSIRTVY